LWPKALSSGLIPKQGNTWAANNLARAAVLILIFLGVAFFLVVLFLFSPLPISVAEFWFSKSYPATGYFKIKEMNLLPWQPFEARDVEYQVSKNLKEGVWKVRNIQVLPEWNTLYRTPQGLIRLSKIGFLSETLEVEDISAEIPFHLKPNPAYPKIEGFLTVARIWSSNFSIRNLEVKVFLEGDIYRGELKGEWTGGNFEGEFKYEPFRGQFFSIHLRLIDMELASFSKESSGILEGALGKCGGELAVSSENFKTVHVRSRVACPKPGGRLHAEFLRGLADWVPEGVAKDVLKEEVEGKGDYYYYDEGYLEVHNETPGYWSFNLMLKNPRLKLELPVDVSEESFGVILNSPGVQKIFKKGE
jgi:hypothetical protein